MKIVSTAKEMQEIDERAIVDYGVPSLELMENAGQGVVEALTRRFHDLSTKRILVFCGKGNNGGDGFVAARLLFNMGVRVTVLLLEKQVNLKKDAAINAESACKLGIKIIEVEKTNVHLLEHSLENCDIVIDALSPTKIKGIPAVSNICAELKSYAVNVANGDLDCLKFLIC